MTNIEKFNHFLDERMRLASSKETLSAYTIVKSTFNRLFKPEDCFHPEQVYEIERVLLRSFGGDFVNEVKLKLLETGGFDKPPEEDMETCKNPISCKHPDCTC